MSERTKAWIKNKGGDKIGLTSLLCTEAAEHQPSTALRLLGSFLRAILKAEWSPIILSRGFENFFHTFSFVQNNKTILITLKCFV